ncbi:MAG: DUF1217 domain-containing protein [Hyphomicrobiales bacterium]
MTTVGTYLSVANNLTRWRGIAARKPQVASDTKYFQANIGKATSIDALMKDRRLLNYALKAFGLGDMTYAVGMMRKVLEQGVDSSRDLANTLNNANILAFAKAFDYAGGAAQVGSADFAKTVTDRYVEQAMQGDQGNQNPGVQLALYFRQRAPQLTSIYGVLADKSLLKVVQTALDIPAASSRQPVDTQARLLKARVNIADFKDAKKLDAFIARFAAMYDTQNPGAGSNVDPSANALLYSASFLGSDQPVGVDMSLLLRRQNAARGF